MTDPVDNDLQPSAERVYREPWFQHWIKQANQQALDRLRGAKSHEDLMRAQAFHQAVFDIKAAVKRAGKL